MYGSYDMVCDRWMDRWTDEQTDRWMDWKSEIDIDFPNWPNFIFKVKHVIIEEDIPSKNIAVEEEPDSIDIDDIGNLDDLPKLAFINEECGNLTEFTKNINKKKKSDISQIYRC